jgi:hypothetical protein
VQFHASHQADVEVELLGGAHELIAHVVGESRAAREPAALSAPV